MEDLQGRTALVTGGTGGIGRAIVERFLAEEARVAFTGRDEGRADELLGRGDRERLRFVRADVLNRESVDRATRETVEAFGGLDVLVNNAGTGLAARLVDTPARDWDRIMDVNVRGYLWHAQAAWPHLVASGHASIVHIASDAALLGEPSIGAYSVSKAAVIMLSNMLALDGAPDGIRSNCVCPGNTVPGMVEMGPPGRVREREPIEAWKPAPIGRLGRPEDVAEAVLYLASDRSGFTTGCSLAVDGGWRAGLLGT